MRVTEPELSTAPLATLDGPGDPSAVSCPDDAKPCDEATGPGPRRAPTFPRLFVEDLAHVGASPAHMHGKDLVKVGLGAAAVVTTALVLDKPAQRFAQGHRNGVTNAVGRFGYYAGSAWGTGAAVAGAYIGGRPDVAQDLLAGGLISTAVVHGLKYPFGRHRPNSGDGPFTFTPFSGDASLPSGHTAGAASMYGVMRAHFPGSDVVKYGGAALVVSVAAARVNDNAHHVSDTVAGALLGYAIGNRVAKYNMARRADGRAMSVTPTVGPGGVGLAFHATF
jgi:membrane-associated phospholipid phosphatase